MHVLEHRVEVVYLRRGRFADVADGAGLGVLAVLGGGGEEDEEEDLEGKRGVGEAPAESVGDFDHCWRGEEGRGAATGREEWGVGGEVGAGNMGAR